MPRNLVLCFDGTNNQFGPQNTSVVRLVQVLDRESSRQRLYYDPGVGTLPEPGVMSAIGKKVSEWYGLAFGAGLVEKVQRGYQFLMEMWQPGDQVFLFGFSRGAYSARVLAGLLHGLGLLPRGNDNLVPYVMRLYRSIAGGSPQDKKAYLKLCDDFRWTFAKKMRDGPDDDRRFPVRFMGLWDTVSSVGYVWEPAVFQYTAYNPGVEHVRHAIAIDERRCFFRQNLMHPANGQDIQQRWFAGVHSDIGGGYPADRYTLWRRPFDWILQGATSAGLLLDDDRVRQVLGDPIDPPRSWAGEQNESLKGLWWGAEFFPKLVYNWETRRRRPQLGLGRCRRLPDGACLDRSVLERIRAGDYQPRDFPDAFIRQIKEMESVPDCLAFKRQDPPAG